MTLRPKNSVCVRIGLALVFALGSLQAGAGVAVEGLRLWRGTDHTRLVFDVDGPVRHSLTEMHDPERLVIDVENGELAAARPVIAALRSALRREQQPGQPPRGGPVRPGAAPGTGARSADGSCGTCRAGGRRESRAATAPGAGSASVAGSARAAAGGA